MRAPSTSAAPASGTREGGSVSASEGETAPQAGGGGASAHERARAVTRKNRSGRSDEHQRDGTAARGNGRRRGYRSLHPAPHAMEELAYANLPRPPKPKKKAKRRRYAKPAATGTYAYESVPVSVRSKKRKA